MSKLGTLAVGAVSLVALVLGVSSALAWQSSFGVGAWLFGLVALLGIGAAAYLVGYELAPRCEECGSLRRRAPGICRGCLFQIAQGKELRA